MAIRSPAFALLLAISLAGCGEPQTGPLKVSAIGGEPELVNPNLHPLDPASAFLAEAVAQGLVRFDAAGEIEPALAQSWIVSDDGLRYTFRLRRTEWNGGGEVTAQQVVRRLQAALSRASRNPLKPTLAVVDEIEAMTDQVLEISLKAPRPNFLQLLAQPEMAIVREGRGTGPYRIVERDGAVALALPEAGEDDQPGPIEPDEPAILLRGERAAMAVARFAEGEADLVVGGTAGDLPFVRAAPDSGGALSFDPVGGMFGLAFATDRGLLGEAEVRRALNMAIDRQAIIEALNVPALQPRTSPLPPGVADLPTPAQPDWSGAPLAMRRELAARTIEGLADGEPLRVRVAMPAGPGYRILFAHLRRDWAAIGIEAERVGLDDEAELRFLDRVAPVNLASWYLRQFTCEESPVCDEGADELLAAASGEPRGPERQALLGQADRILTGITPFLPIAAPVRWNLASPRTTGFRTNVFARHPAGELIADRP